MAGGVGRVKSLTQARPDLGTLKMLAGVRSLRDDELLRAAAKYLEEHGLTIVAPTEVVPQVLAQEGHLAGPTLSPQQWRDVESGREVAAALDKADVGQTVVVKRSMPGQDTRFDLQAGAGCWPSSPRAPRVTPS